MITPLEIKEVEGVKDVMDSMWEGEAKLYKLSREVSTISAIPEVPPTLTDHIVVSAVEYGDDTTDDMYSQTYVFPSDDQGVPLNMGHLKGSIDGRLDHHRAVSNFIVQHMTMEVPTDG